MTIRQADIARELGVSEMTISRVFRKLQINGRTLTDFAALLVFVCEELQVLDKLRGSVAIRLVAEFESEIRYVTADRTRRCWIVFAENAHGPFRMAAHTSTHLESLLAAFPLSLTLAAHEIVARASERLKSLQAKLSKEAP